MDESKSNASSNDFLFRRFKLTVSGAASEGSGWGEGEGMTSAMKYPK